MCWCTSTPLGASFALRLDGLTSLFCLLVLGVGTLIMMYCPRYLPARGRHGLDRPVHHAAASVQHRRRPGHELPPAAQLAALAGDGLRAGGDERRGPAPGARHLAGGLRPRARGRLPILQLRGRDADRVGAGPGGVSSIGRGMRGGAAAGTGHHHHWRLHPHGAQRRSEDRVPGFPRHRGRPRRDLDARRGARPGR